MNESFEQALEPQPTKRKRSSILRLPEKRFSRDRDSRTVSFNEKCLYKELHQDGTCNITNLLLNQDMELTMMVACEEPNSFIAVHDRTINDSADMSMDTQNQNNNNNDSSPENSLQSRTEQFSEEQQQQPELQPQPELPPQKQQVQQQYIQQHPQSQQPQLHDVTPNESACSMDLTLINNFILYESPKSKSITIDLSSMNYDTSTIYEKKMSLATDISSISSLNSSIIVTNSSATSDSTLRDTTQMRNISQTTCDNTTMLHNTSMGFSDISNGTLVPDQSANESFFGSLNESNMSMSSKVSGMDSIMHNIEALNDCVHKVDQELEECASRLDREIEEIFKFYRHVVNKDDKYEFAIKIFGLRQSIWLIFRINPMTYPREKLNLRFAVNKRDRHLYPYAEFSEAVRKVTKEGNYGYLTQFIINAQKFRRFLRKINYRKK